MVLIDRFRPEELVAVLRMAKKTLNRSFPPEFFIRMASLEPDLFLVARDEVTANPVGFLIAARSEAAEARVLLMGVDPYTQGQGIGHQLMRQLQRRLTVREVRGLELEVRLDNPRAIEFYQREGFYVEGLKEKLYEDGGDGLFMRKPIA